MWAYNMTKEINAILEQNILFTFNFRLAEINVLITMSTFSKASSNVFPKQIMSSLEINQTPLPLSSFHDHFHKPRNIAGVLHNPKGKMLNWKYPLWVEKAVLCFAPSSTSTCQYPEARSHKEPHKESRHSDILLRGYIFCYAGCIF